MDKFKINTTIKSSEPNIQEYINSIHAHLLSFQVNNVIQMVVSLDNVSKSIIEDLDKITRGEVEGLKILTDDSKTFEKVQKIVEKIDSWKKLIEIAEEFKPEIIEVKEGKPKVNIDLNGGNVFESILKSQTSK